MVRTYPDLPGLVPIRIYILLFLYNNPFYSLRPPHTLPPKEVFPWS